MYFTESSVKIPEEKRKRLVFLRACDLNALKRLDEIYLHNGPEDFYYKNIRENAKFMRKFNRITTCGECGKTFVPKRAGAKYCSSACKQKAYRLRKQLGQNDHTEQT